MLDIKGFRTGKIFLAEEFWELKYTDLKVVNFFLKKPDWFRELGQHI